MTREEFLKLTIDAAWNVHENDQSQVLDTVTRIEQALSEKQAVADKAAEDASTAKEASDTALKAAQEQASQAAIEFKAKSDEQIAGLEATVKELQANLEALGGEPLALQRKQEAAIKAAKERMASDTRLLNAAGEDAVAVVSAEVAKTSPEPAISLG